MNTLNYIAWSLSSLSFLAALPGQIGGNGRDGVLNPSSNITLDTTSRPGGFDYRSIHIPAGVTVSLIGSNHAILRSQGAVTIAGRLSADSGPGATASAGGIGGPGGYDGGAGGLGRSKAGKGPAGGAGAIAPFGQAGFGGYGGHATPGTVFGGTTTGTYGSALPFDLRGGSGAGGTALPWSWQQPGAGGAGGGGTVVLLADGAVRVTKTGSVTARSIGMGAGGSIMFRSMHDLRVEGKIDAAGKKAIWSTGAGDGFIRLDSYGKQPDIATGAVVTPPPKRMPIPAIRAESTLRVGGTYILRAAAAPGELVGFYASLGSASIPLPSLGVLGLDPSTLLFLGAVPTATTGVDPQARLALPVPNDARLRGLRVYLQAINAWSKAAAGPKLSNVLSPVVQ